MPLVTTLSPLAAAALQVLSEIEGGHRSNPPASGVIERLLRKELERHAPDSWKKEALAVLPPHVAGDPQSMAEYLAERLRGRILGTMPRDTVETLDF